MAIGVRPAASPRPVNFLRPCLLLLLDERPGHGYELSERLTPLAGPAPDTAVVYRALNAMEDEGLVSSRWERSTEGPVRRCHELTPRGRSALADCETRFKALNEPSLAVGEIRNQAKALATHLQALSDQVGQVDQEMARFQSIRLSAWLSSWMSLRGRPPLSLMVHPSSNAISVMNPSVLRLAVFASRRLSGSSLESLNIAR